MIYLSLSLNDDLLDKVFILLQIQIIHVTESHSRRVSQDTMSQLHSKYLQSQADLSWQAQDFEKLLPVAIFEGLGLEFGNERVGLE